MLSRFARCLAICITVGLFIVGWSAPARAQTAIAEKLYQEGIELAQKGDFAPACPKFQASYELDAQVGTLMALAACNVELGKTASAWGEYNEAASLARRQDKPAVAEVAQKAAVELQPKLSMLAIKIDKPLPNMVVTLDGKVVPRGALGDELPMDPGQHELKADAPGHDDWVKELTIQPGPASLNVRIPALVPTKAPTQAPVIVTTGLNDNQVIGYTVGALGIAGVVIGTIFGIVATLETNNADDNCIQQFCTQEGLDGHDRALAFAHISTIGFAVGGAGIGTGLILILTAPDPTVDNQDPTQPKAGAWMLEIGGTW